MEILPHVLERLCHYPALSRLWRDISPRLACDLLGTLLEIIKKRSRDGTFGPGDVFINVGLLGV